ncbi:Tox-REase-5 domain-containing protein [Hyalangium rubrum]|uniref:Tox-REase-5 domain-containing protein n=1 Tax=Hyalangium rubrum TaxID=3103134 RepID=A0ABU5HJ19_9BACT|nr:Tox-REase-5 domain-containing protein [Hyalangium sp. s54d21]MDY7233152.1 Tox-REase-5 domain-containing protein [Hyalangium sp. s54d21]
MQESLRYRPSTPQEHPDATAARKRGALARLASQGRAGPGSVVTRSVASGLVRVDAFEELLRAAGVDNYFDLPKREAPFTPEDAAALYDLLLEKPVTLAGFGPRRVVAHMLHEVMEGQTEVPRAELLQRIERFRFLAVLRPDGYLAWALNGRTQQRVAPVQWKDGAFRAHGFEVGRFYSARNHMGFFPVDEYLRERREAGLLAEVYDDADVISRTMDGAEASFFELGQSLGTLVVHPVDSAAALTQLPGALAQLIAQSPEYLARFKLMTRGEQIEALSKMATTLLSMYGVAGGTTRTVAAAGRGLEVISVPALSLTAEGALVMERVALPVGQFVTTLSGGPGAAIILQRANQTASGAQPAQGPGQWGPARESMSRRAARYQAQISGRPAGEAYWIGGVDTKMGGVKFDGFQEGVLLEAKGPGYANKFLDSLDPHPWFKNSGAKSLLEQARRQLQVANGIPIRWHVAEKKSADAIRKLLRNGGILSIKIVHTPMVL